MRQTDRQVSMKLKPVRHRRIVVQLPRAIKTLRFLPLPPAGLFHSEIHKRSITKKNHHTISWSRIDKTSLIMAERGSRNTDVYHEDISLYEGSMNHGDEKTIPFLRWENCSMPMLWERVRNFFARAYQRIAQPRRTFVEALSLVFSAFWIIHGP